jgi:hypothetical protein
LVQYVATELQRQSRNIEAVENAHQPGWCDMPLDPQQVDQLLASLDSMSDAEVDRLLGDLLATQRLAA